MATSYDIGGPTLLEHCLTETLSSYTQPFFRSMRRYLFFSESMLAWLVRLVAHPTHIMILNGVYVRVPWVSEAQMEFDIYIHQCYNIASPRTPLMILEHPQCHFLADVCKGRSELFLQAWSKLPFSSDKCMRAYRAESGTTNLCGSVSL